MAFCDVMFILGGLGLPKIISLLLFLIKASFIKYTAEVTLLWCVI